MSGGRGMYMWGCRYLDQGAFVVQRSLESAE